MDELGWDDVPVHKRVYSRGIIMAIPTEFDLTYAGCKILGLHFDIAAAKYNKTEELDFAEELEYLEYIISKERYKTLQKYL